MSTIINLIGYITHPVSCLVVVGPITKHEDYCGGRSQVFSKHLGLYKSKMCLINIVLHCKYLRVLRQSRFDETGHGLKLV